MISINVTLIVQVLQFLILAFILNRLMFRPLLKAINERESYTEKTKGEIKDFELKIGQLKEEFISKESAAREDAAKERFDLKEGSIAKAEGFMDESRKEVASIRGKTAKEVEEEINKAQPLLHDQAALLVDEMTEQIIGRRITA
jgi:F-type H+-transporting ATPase subunit b